MSTLLFISVVVNKLWLQVWTSRTSMSVSSCLKFNWHCLLSPQPKLTLRCVTAVFKGMRRADLIGYDRNQLWHTSTLPLHHAAQQMHLRLCSPNFKKDERDVEMNFSVAWIFFSLSAFLCNSALHKKNCIPTKPSFSPVLRGLSDPDVDWEVAVMIPDAYGTEVALNLSHRCLTKRWQCYDSHGHNLYLQMLEYQ